MTLSTWAALGLLWTAADAAPVSAVAAEVPRIDTRYAKEGVTESPDFRQHVVPLMGKLGCNGRACHGSFQGQGGFRLSLFGYDFKADHENLLAGDEPRTNLKAPADSPILQKPTLGIPHEGGKRLDLDTWQYRVLHKWVTDGAQGVTKETAEFVRLDITPAEMIAKQKGDTWQLKAVAVWSDGTQEDVTPLCRFQSNNDQVATITEKGLVTAQGPGDSHVVAFYDNGVVPVPMIHPVSDKVGPNYPSTPTPTKIDQLVVQKLRKLGVVQADVATDAEFLRRVSIDIAGTLPTAAEVEAFLNDSTGDKRAKKIDELLERPAYAAWWATKFADFTGNNSTQQVNNGNIPALTAATEWYEWLRKRIADNTPYDQMVSGIVLAKGRLDNESYREYCERISGYYAKDPAGKFADQPSLTHYWTRRNFAKPDERALGFAYTFLGVRIQCAQCHKHPFDQWTKDDFERFTGFFGRTTYNTTPDTKDEYKSMMADLGIETKGKNNNDLQKMLQAKVNDGKVVPFRELYSEAPKGNPSNNRKDKGNDKGKKQQVVSGRTAKVLGGEEVKIGEMDDPREALMEWMRDEQNPYFAKAIVNRVWASYFHRGIVEPADDLSLANPPCNEELIDYLAASFREHGYDLKWLHREICNSRTYQLSWKTNETNRLDDRNFSHAVPRRIPAEVAYDAIRSATASDQEAAKLQTEVADRSIADPIVVSRGNGRAKNTYALTVFGRSIRDSNCDCDRSSEASLLQTVFLQNDKEALDMITRKGSWLDQVVRNAKGESEDEERATKRKQAERQIDQLEAALKKAEAADKEERVKQVKEQLAAARERAAELRKVSEEPAAKLQPQDAASIVRQAYLRTLNRPPTDEETQRATAFFTETGDLALGARDLLWALLNTKEFVVNH
jgi:hypothetical protein